MPTKTLPDAGTRSRRSPINCCSNAKASDPKLRFGSARLGSARRRPGPRHRSSFGGVRQMAGGPVVRSSINVLV